MGEAARNVVRRAAQGAQHAQRHHEGAHADIDGEHAVDEPDADAVEQRDAGREPGVDAAGADEPGYDDRSQAIGRADRQIELARDHQIGPQHRDDADEGRGADDVEDVAPGDEVVGADGEEREQQDRDHGHGHLTGQQDVAERLDAPRRAGFGHRLRDGAGRARLHGRVGRVRRHGHTDPEVRRLTTSCLLVSAFSRSAILVPCLRTTILSARSNTVSRL